MCPVLMSCALCRRRGVEEAVQWLLEVLPDCERTRQLGNSAD